MIRLYTDGSYRDGVCSWAYVIVDEYDNIIEQEQGTTDDYPESRNVAGEIKAVIYGLRRCAINRFYDIDIYNDYIGLEKWLTGEWQAKTELTQIYVKMMQDVVSKVFPVRFHHVKAHSGDHWNEYVDRMAKEVIGL